MPLLCKINTKQNTTSHDLTQLSCLRLISPQTLLYKHLLEQQHKVVKNIGDSSRMRNGDHVGLLMKTGSTVHPRLSGHVGQPFSKILTG